jgi:hypothetical protein
VNSAYKHLDSKLKIAELTLGQWFGLMVGVAVAIVWGFYLSPLSPYLTMGTAVYMGAVPVGLALMSTFYEVDVAIVARSAITWVRLDGQFMPGPGSDASGYLVRIERPEEDAATSLSTLDLAALWE